MSPIADGLGGERGFVGGTKDATGLAGIGARDSAFQRFITVDPIQNLADPLHWDPTIGINQPGLTASPI